jgi:cation diffusion facilitator CzcD-associated flavoprotein CzcO
MDAPISTAWQNRFKKYPFVQSLFRSLLYLQFEILNRSLRYPMFVQRLQSAGLKNIQRGIQDPQLRAKVTPDYSVGCKRILQSNTWYRALAQPNVQVVSGIAEIQGSTLIASDGTQCEVDALVFATGFEVADPPIAQRIVGVSGQTLASLWGGSASAYYGTMVQDCPNLFLTFGPNLYTFSSAFVIIEAQLQWIASALKTAKEKKLCTISVDPLQFATYNSQVQVALKDTVWNSGCSSYFIDKNGRNSTNWPWTTFYMRWKLSRFKAQEFLVDTGP